MAGESTAYDRSSIASGDLAAHLLFAEDSGNAASLMTDSQGFVVVQAARPALSCFPRSSFPSVRCLAVELASYVACLAPSHDRPTLIPPTALGQVRYAHHAQHLMTFSVASSSTEAPAVARKTDAACCSHAETVKPLHDVCRCRTAAVSYGCALRVASSLLSCSDFANSQPTKATALAVWCGAR